MALIIDIGSTNVKVLSAHAGRITSCAATRNSLLDDGTFDTARVICAVEEALKQAAGSTVVQHVSISCFVQSTVGCRIQSNDACTETLCYANSRPATYHAVDSLRQSLDAFQYHDRVGAPLHAAYAPAQIASHPSARHVTWSSVPTLLCARWAGLPTGAVGVSPSEAAWAGMLDGRQAADGRWRWDGCILDVLRLSEYRRPQPSPHDVGDLTAGNDLRSMVPSVRPGSFHIQIGGPSSLITQSSSCLYVPESQASHFIGLLGQAYIPATGVKLWLGLGDGAGAAVGSGCLPIPRHVSQASGPPLHVLALTVGTSAALRTVITASQAARVLCRGCQGQPPEAKTTTTISKDTHCPVCGRLRLSRLGLWAYPFTDCSLEEPGPQLEHRNAPAEEHQGQVDGHSDDAHDSTHGHGYVLIGGALTDGGSLIDYFGRQFGVRPPSVAPAETVQQGSMEVGPGREATPNTASTADVGSATSPAATTPHVYPSDLTCLPFVSGERSTGWAGAARCTFAGMDATTGPEDMLRAAMDAVAFRLAVVFERLQMVLAFAQPTESDREPTDGAAPTASRTATQAEQRTDAHDTEVYTKIICSGGGLSANPTWCQIIANAMGQPVHVPRPRPAAGSGTGPQGTPASSPSAPTATSPSELGLEQDLDATTLGTLMMSRLHWARHPVCPTYEREQLLKCIVEYTRAARDEGLSTGTAGSGNSGQRTFWTVYSPDQDASVQSAWARAFKRHGLLYEALEGLHGDLLPQDRRPSR